MAYNICSIGHSNKTIDKFISELKGLKVDLLVDLRSQPFSKYVPQFNKENLKASLEDEKIEYLYFGDKLGGRPKEGIDNFIKSEKFKQNVTELLLKIKDTNSALMCTEADQRFCHRRFIVEEIEKRGIIVHIEGKSDKDIINYVGNNDKLKFEKESDKNIINFSHNVKNDKIKPKQTLLDNSSIKLYTIGFTQKSAKEFFESLKENSVKTLIDIRLNNKGQLAGFTKEEDLKYFLKTIDNIEYIHIPIFAPSEEMLKRYRSKEMKWNQYEQEYLKLLNERNILDKFDHKILKDACLLCSEKFPKECHRRLLAEYLQAYIENIAIIHL